MVPFPIHCHKYWIMDDIIFYMSCISSPSKLHSKYLKTGLFTFSNGRSKIQMLRIFWSFFLKNAFKMARKKRIQALEMLKCFTECSYRSIMLNYVPSSAVHFTGNFTIRKTVLLILWRPDPIIHYEITIWKLETQKFQKEYVVHSLNFWNRE